MPCDDETFQSPAVDISLVNTSLSSMGESPIQPKKLAGSKRYSKEKLDRIAGAFCKKLKIDEEVDDALGKNQKLIQYYNEMSSQRKERFTRAENKFGANAGVDSIAKNLEYSQSRKRVQF